ncbi:MAG: glycolate oxidase [Gemmatimonadales bacterium]|nr:MAG: glycolate oxidase [Gemmatimonadales bacterium]
MVQKGEWRRLEALLKDELEGEVLFDRFARGRYSTDASIYQIEPVGVVLPRSEEDVVRTVQIAASEGVPIVPRGAGTSQSGQAIGPGLVIDTSKWLNRIIRIDEQAGYAVVEPGVVLEHLNSRLRPSGLFFPIDPATAAQATLGGMAGNNSAGARSIKYGMMVDHVLGIEAVLSDGTRLHFGYVPADLSAFQKASVAPESERYVQLVRAVRAIYLREAEEIASRYPKVLRNVAGYNLNRVSLEGHNMAHLLVGSEGTLAFFTKIHLKLSALPPSTALGVCHFPSLRAAMEAVPQIVTLGPSAVELVDDTLLGLARANPMFAGRIKRFVQGEPKALLLVEFTGDDPHLLERSLASLDQLMGTLGYPQSVISAVDPAFQREIWRVRREALNIVMSMRGDTKPVSFIEDCAVPLEHLAEYTSLLSEVFRKHGVSGTWYAHASVGCLHVRPALNLKDPADVKKMRAIAEEAHELVRRFKGSHSGEHGDGLVRSEFLEPMLGRRLVQAFEEVKRAFDPEGLFNPGKIVNPPRMDDRTLFRYRPDYSPLPLDTVLDWSEWGSLLGAVEMCNNNGACRQAQSGVMCPSYRVTRDEEHVTRGRANTLRLALTGQLGPEAFTSEEMYATLELCISCKACRRECPTGVDLARMKLEFLARYRRRRRPSLRDRLFAYLPRYAPRVARAPWIVNLPQRLPGFGRIAEWALGISRQRTLPRWRRDFFRDGEFAPPEGESGREILLWVDTFNTYFEPENARAAVAVLRAAGYTVRIAAPKRGARPLCCGRTFLSAGLIDQAREEARRVVEALADDAARGTPVVGLEPSCLLTLRDEFTVLFPRKEVEALSRNALLLEELLASDETARGRLEKNLRPLDGRTLLLHGHCHQKAFGVMGAVEEVLRLIPGVSVRAIESTCCGMAGAFGYEAEHYRISLQMAELSLFPAIRNAGAGVWIVADGISCRRQIADGLGRPAWHAVRVLESSISGTLAESPPEI